MLDRFTYKQRNFGLLGVFILSAWLVYSLALSTTIDLAGSCSQREADLASVQNAPQRIAALKAEQAAIDRVLGEEGRILDFQQALLEKVSDYCQDNKLVLREFPKPIAKKENNYLVETNLVVVEGKFSKLLTLVYELEQQDRLGKIAAVEFRTERPRRGQPAKLTASIYVQNVKKANNEA